MAKGGSERRRDRGPESTEPSIDVPAPSYPSTYEPSHVIQLLVGLQKETTAINTKLDRAIADLGDVEEKVSKLSTTLTWIKGFGTAAVVLIPLCAAIIWWLVGDSLTQMKAQLIQAAKEPPIIVPKGK